MRPQAFCIFLVLRYFLNHLCGLCYLIFVINISGPCNEYHLENEARTNSAVYLSISISLPVRCFHCHIRAVIYLLSLTNIVFIFPSLYIVSICDSLLLPPFSNQVVK